MFADLRVSLVVGLTGQYHGTIRRKSVADTRKFEMTPCPVCFDPEDLISQLILALSNLFGEDTTLTTVLKKNDLHSMWMK